MLTALLLSMTLAAPGDIEAILHVAPAEADQPVKTKLVLSIEATYPASTPETVQRYYCSRDTQNSDATKWLDFNCDGAYKKRVTIKQHVDLSIAHEVADSFDGAPEGFVDILKKAPRKNVPHGSAAWTAIDVLVQQTFAGLEATDIFDFSFWRDKEDVNKIIDRATYFDIVTEATMSTLLRVKAVHKIIGRVP